MEQRGKKRSIAVKMSVHRFLSCTFKKSEDGSSVLADADGEHGRVNIIATVVGVQERGVMVDDGTGTLSVRSFGDEGVISPSHIGDVVMVVGRPREYAGERYVVPEIVRKVEAGWLVLRSAELNHKKDTRVQVQETAHARGEEAEDGQEGVQSDAERLVLFVRNADKGDGVDVEHIVARANVSGAEAILSSMLRNGDLFEVRPGRVKLLE